jgi:hypothetical protein
MNMMKGTSKGRHGESSNVVMWLTAEFWNGFRFGVRGGNTIDRKTREARLQEPIRELKQVVKRQSRLVTEVFVKKQNRKRQNHHHSPWRGGHGHNPPGSKRSVTLSINLIGIRSFYFYVPAAFLRR